MHRIIKLFHYTLLILIFFGSANLPAIDVENKEFPLAETKNTPWLTGPLLAPSGNVVPLGSINIEPYLYCTYYTGVYGLDWKTTSRPVFSSYALNIPIQFGIAPRVDFTISPTVFMNRTQGKHAWGFGDIILASGIQLVKEGERNPSVKLALQELFPSGKYDHLNPELLFTDGTGGGSYVSTIGLVIGKFLVVKKNHDVNIRFTAAYSVPSSVFLKGLNFYGGAPNTRGRYYPCQLATMDLGLEYSITRNWALALDVLYNYATRTKFVGKHGEGLVSPVGGILTEVSSQFSLAPAMEYNWSQSLGLIAGAWFTIAGRNVNIFRSAVIAINYYK